MIYHGSQSGDKCVPNPNPVEFCFCQQRGEQKPADGLILSVFRTLEQFSAVNEEQYIQMKLSS